MGSEGQLQNGTRNSEVFIVDDDALVRETMSIVFNRAGYQVATFCDGRSFVEAARIRVPTCVIMDVCMPGLSGVEILKQLDAVNYPAPIFIVSGRGDIPTAVEAIRNGACDFIEKHTDAALLVERVGRTTNAWARRRRTNETSEIRWRQFPGRFQLTRREIEVLAQIVASASNKETAATLGISPRTVEIHRLHIMKKLGAKNVADLMRIVLNANGEAPRHSGPRTVPDGVMRSSP